MSDSFIFYRSFAKALNAVDDETRLKVYDALVMYALNNEEPSCSGIAYAMFALMQPQIDANNRRRNSASSGGKAKAAAHQNCANGTDQHTQAECQEAYHNCANGTNQHTQAECQNVPNDNANVNANANINVNVNENENENDADDGGADAASAKAGAARTSRHKYGEHKNVTLTDTELDKLKSQYPRDWDERIEKLSAYMAYKGAVYKSHYLTILNWAKRDAEKRERDEPDYSDPSRYINMDMCGFRRAADDEFDKY